MKGECFQTSDNKSYVGEGKGLLDKERAVDDGVAHLPPVARHVTQARRVKVEWRWKTRKSKECDSNRSFHVSLTTFQLYYALSFVSLVGT